MRDHCRCRCRRPGATTAQLQCPALAHARRSWLLLALAGCAHAGCADVNDTVQVKWQGFASNLTVCRLVQLSGGCASTSNATLRSEAIGLCPVTCKAGCAASTCPKRDEAVNFNCTPIEKGGRTMGRPLQNKCFKATGDSRCELVASISDCHTLPRASNATIRGCEAECFGSLSTMSFASKQGGARKVLLLVNASCENTSLLNYPRGTRAFVSGMYVVESNFHAKRGSCPVAVGLFDQIIDFRPTLRVPGIRHSDLDKSGWVLFTRPPPGGVRHFGFNCGDYCPGGIDASKSGQCPSWCGEKGVCCKFGQKRINCSGDVGVKDAGWTCVPAAPLRSYPDGGYQARYYAVGSLDYPPVNGWTATNFSVPSSTIIVHGHERATCDYNKIAAAMENKSKTYSACATWSLLINQIMRENRQHSFEALVNYAGKSGLSRDRAFARTFRKINCGCVVMLSAEEINALDTTSGEPCTADGVHFLPDVHQPVPLKRVQQLCRRGSTTLASTPTNCSECRSVLGDPSKLANSFNGSLRRSESLNQNVKLKDACELHVQSACGGVWPKRCHEVARWIEQCDSALTTMIEDHWKLKLWASVLLCMLCVLCCVVTILWRWKHPKRGFWADAEAQYSEMQQMLDEEQRASTESNDAEVVERIEVRLLSASEASQRPWKVVTNKNCRELHVDEDKLLGTGSFGMVYKADWHGMAVAVKRLTLSTKDLDSFLRIKAELLVEAEFHANLEHVNVLRMFGITTSPQMCLVLELAARGSVYDLLHDKQRKLVFTEEHVDVLLTGALDIAEGMAYLHGENILHRDLKCLNVLVSEDWVYKIADFGISRVKALDEEHVTQAMTQVGTPKWTAPEIFRGAKYNESVDIWSYAMTLFEMLTGEVPFEEFSQVEVAYFVTTEHRHAHRLLGTAGGGCRLRRRYDSLAWASPVLSCAVGTDS